MFPDPSDDARLREAELDALPRDTAGAIRELSSYEWRSQAAAQTFEQLKDLLRREVLDSQFRGMKDAMSQSDPEAMQRVKDMMAALTSMIEADSGVSTPSRTSTTSWRSTANSSPTHRRTSKTWSTRWSAGWRPRNDC